jgi:hypothetical protein
MRKMLRILLIHSREIRHISEENRDLDDFGNAGACSCQHSGGVLDGEGGLFLDCALGEDVAGGVAGDGARGEYEAVGFDGVGLWK